MNHSNPTDENNTATTAHGMLPCCGRKAPGESWIYETEHCLATGSRPKGGDKHFKPSLFKSQHFTGNNLLICVLELGCTHHASQRMTQLLAGNRTQVSHALEESPSHRATCRSTARCIFRAQRKVQTLSNESSHHSLRSKPSNYIKPYLLATESLGQGHP